ncbi:hypothetical protein TRIP_D440368 [uncultured Paludibacter sp.]|nr:hypothetical protein TRIP_D440368 [uncultured Paludibacter sp.]
MKSKILLTIIFGSIGFAVYFFFSNLQNAQNEIYYSMTSVNTKPVLILENNKNIAKSKKKYSNPGNSTSSPDGFAVTLNTNTANSSLSSTTLDENNNQGATNKIRIGINNSNKKKDIELVSSTTTTTGILLAKASGSKKANNLLASAGSISSISSTSHTSTGKSTMNAPVFPSTTDDIIVDPGGDPESGSMIPVGEGNHILISLTISYLIFSKYKENKIQLISIIKEIIKNTK